jgi:hypothetical protein
MVAAVDAELSIVASSGQRSTIGGVIAEAGMSGMGGGFCKSAGDDTTGCAGGFMVGFVASQRALLHTKAIRPETHNNEWLRKSAIAHLPVQDRKRVELLHLFRVRTGASELIAANAGAELVNIPA